jgi:hypothetical protein
MRDSELDGRNVASEEKSLGLKRQEWTASPFGQFPGRGVSPLTLTRALQLLRPATRGAVGARFGVGAGARRAA